jgi:hypothetical protein
MCKYIFAVNNCLPYIISDKLFPHIKLNFLFNKFN